MKKIAMSVAAATMLMSGLTACGGTDDNQSTDPNATGYEAQNLNGYNNNGTLNGNNASHRYRGQGPLTDMLTPDGNRNGNLGQDGGTRFQSENYNNMTRRNGFRANNYTNQGMTGNNLPGMVDNDGLLRGRARDGAMNGANNNGTMQNRGFNAQNNNGTMRNSGSRAQNDNGTMNYHKDYDSRTAQKIARSVTKMNGVDDARVIVHQNDVIVGVETNGDRNNVQNQVEKKVKELADGKEVQVVTDADAVGRIRTMDDRLRTGTAFDEVGATFTDMLNDLGNAVQRPFERSR